MMTILIAEDDPISRRALELMLTRWEFAVTAVEDGGTAWEILKCPDSPKLAILDWMMPILDGPEVCRRIQEQKRDNPPYLILLTARGTKEDKISGLRAGADDYVTKPFDRDELLARIQVGLRIIQLQQKLSDRVTELESALANVKQLQGLLPICCYCKKIRNDDNYWQQVDAYLAKHLDTQFSHGICPDCYHTVVQAEIQAHVKKAVASESQVNP